MASRQDLLQKIAFVKRLKQRNTELAAESAELERALRQKELQQMGLDIVRTKHLREMHAESKARVGQQRQHLGQLQ